MTRPDITAQFRGNVSRSNEQRGTPVHAWPGSDGISRVGSAALAATSRLVVWVGGFVIGLVLALIVAQWIGVDVGSARK